VVAGENVGDDWFRHLAWDKMEKILGDGNGKENDREFPGFDQEVAIQEALDDVANGDRGVPFEEFDREFRKRHNLPATP
jgi:hypothetical protein